MMYAIEEREFILGFLRGGDGSRMMCNYMRFGGVAMDLTRTTALRASLMNDRVRDFIP